MAKEISAPTVAELAQKVTDLEGEKTQLTTDLKTANDELTVQTGKAVKLKGELKIADEAKTKLEADLKISEAAKTKLEGDLKIATAAREKAEAELKTTDDRTENRLREISARNGGTLPPKNAQTGNFTGEGGAAETKTRADFDKLSAKDRAGFCSKGGKITD